MGINVEGKYFRAINTIKTAIFFFIAAIFLAVVSFVLMRSYNFGYIKAEGTIYDIVYLGDDVGTYVQFNIDSGEVIGKLHSTSENDMIGDPITIYYNPNDPTEIQQRSTLYIGIGLAAACLICVIVGVSSIVISSKRGKQMKEQDEKFEQMDKQYAYEDDKEVDQSEFVKYYFRFDKHLNQGHILEDEQKNIVYEAKFVNFRLLGASDCNFVNHVTGKAYLHKIGKTSTSNDDSIYARSSFRYDDKNVLDYIHELGLRIKTQLVANVLNPTYNITYQGKIIATVVSTGAHLHEDDPKRAGFIGDIGVRGMYRVSMNPEYLDYVFLCTMIIARTDNSIYD